MAFYRLILLPAWLVGSVGRALVWLSNFQYTRAWLLARAYVKLSFHARPQVASRTRKQSCVHNYSSWIYESGMPTQTEVWNINTCSHKNECVAFSTHADYSCLQTELRFRSSRKKRFVHGWSTRRVDCVMVVQAAFGSVAADVVWTVLRDRRRHAWTEKAAK